MPEEGNLIEILLWVLIAAFFLEWIDSTLGGGFGTILTPLLLIAGFEPLVIVPCILISEILTGFTVGGLHEKVGNSNIRFSSRSQQSLAALITSGLLGIVFAIYMATLFPSFYVKLYIGILVVCMGALVLIKRNDIGRYNIKKIAALGVLCAFNKGVSGGGYGPVAMSGQLLSDVETKPAIAITSISEASVCFMGITGYALLIGISNITLLLSICLGAILATPLSAYSVSKITMNRLKPIIGWATLIIGIITLFKVFFL